MESDNRLAKLTEAIFEHLPLLFSREAADAQSALNAAGYKMARQPNGQPMLALPVEQDFVAIVVTPGQPPKVKLMGEAATDMFDPLVAGIEGRGFERAASGSSKPGMRVETLSASTPGPIVAISVMRSLASDTVLLAAVTPSPKSPRGSPS